MIGSRRMARAFGSTRRRPGTGGLADLDLPESARIRRGRDGEEGAPIEADDELPLEPQLDLDPPPGERSTAERRELKAGPLERDGIVVADRSVPTEGADPGELGLRGRGPPGRRLDVSRSTEAGVPSGGGSRPGPPWPPSDRPPRPAGARRRGGPGGFRSSARSGPTSGARRGDRSDPELGEGPSDLGRLRRRPTAGPRPPARVGAKIPPIPVDRRREAEGAGHGAQDHEVADGILALAERRGDERPMTIPSSSARGFNDCHLADV